MKRTCSRIRRPEQLPLLVNLRSGFFPLSDPAAHRTALVARTLSPLHEALSQRIGTRYHLEGLQREELDAYLAQQLH